MMFKNVVVAVALAAAGASATSERFGNCYDCVNAGLSWQEEAKSCTQGCLIQDISCATSLSVCDSIAPPPRPTIAPEPPMYGNCYDCTSAGLKWGGNGRCLMQCPQDIACYKTPSSCPGVAPPTKPCDCYVDLRKVPGYQLNYINMWKGRPCGQTLGALYQGRCLNFANGYSLGKRVTSNCGAGKLKYAKLATASGKSVGWVAEKFLVCRRSDWYPPAPAPAPAASQVPTGTGKAY